MFLTEQREESLPSRAVRLAETELEELLGLGDLTHIPPRLDLLWLREPRLLSLAASSARAGGDSTADRDRD